MQGPKTRGRRGAPPGARPKTLSTLLETLIRCGPLDVHELAEASNVSDRTIRKRADELSGCIHIGVDGRFAVSPQAGTVFAVSVARESLRWALVDVHGNRLNSAHEEGIQVSPFNGTPTSPKQFVRKLNRLLWRAIEQISPRPQLKAIAVIWHSPVSITTGDVVRFEANTEGWRDQLGAVPLMRQVLAQAREIDAEVPIVVVNDADAELLGELRYGMARDKRDVLGVKICGGIGASLLANGKLHRGAEGKAGELGHAPVAMEWLSSRTPPPAVRDITEAPPCSCGARDHLECFASARALVERLGLHSEEGSYNEFVDDLLRRDPNDEAVNYVLEDAGLLIGKALRGPVLLTNPELVVVSAYPHRQRLLEAINEQLAGLVPAVLGTPPNRDGDWMGVLGAAAHAADLHVIPDILRARASRSG